MVLVIFKIYCGSFGNLPSHLDFALPFFELSLKMFNQIFKQCTGILTKCM